MNYGKYYNGIAQSEYDNGGFHALVGLDIHSKSGTVTCSKAMTNADTTPVVDGTPTCSVTIPDGNSFFAAGTKIFKVTSAGTVTLVHTSGQGLVLGMDYLGTYLYYCTATKIGRQTLANATSEASWSSETDAWGTFTNQKTYKPMVKQNLSLFIGDGKYVAAVDEAGTFSANVLDLEPNQIVTALVPDREYLLIGTIAGTSSDKSGLFLWDTYSSSWTVSDTIDEKGINCFIPADNTIFISAGTVGNIYYWANRAELFTKLQDAGTTVTTGINPYASANLNGLPLFATSRGIFSLGRSDSKMPIAQCIEYVGSEGQGITTSGALTVSGSQVFYGWNKTSTYGIDKLSTNLYSGQIKTPIFLGKATRIKIAYSSLPASTSITCKLSKDGGAYATHTLVKDATNEMAYRSENSIGNKATVQAEITLTASTTTAPTIYDILVE